jgi:glycosyltransferase involved in cell wall biosynthesis/cytochrome c-type biogenesis protein CcmH/NrfG
MAGNAIKKPKLALVYGNLPTIEEIDQFQLLKDTYDVFVITSESVAEYISRSSNYNDLRCVALPDHDENPTYLPGLEKALAGFDVVIVKERLGLYAYQAVKAKWCNNFRLAVWVDNLTPFPGEDLDQFRIIRQELANAADTFIVQSNAARETLILEGVEASRITFFEPFAAPRVKRSLKGRAKALSVLGLKDGDFLIGHLGQIEWEEDLLLLLHAAKSAMNANASLKRRLRIALCGVGSASEEINERATKLGLKGRIVFVAPGRDAFDTMFMACDAFFYSNTAHHDRMEGDPYRLVTAMVNKVPVIASRNPIVEEYIGKHRVDFCPGSIESLATAIEKASEAKSLVNNIANKNAATFDQRFNQERVTRRMGAALAEVQKREIRRDHNAIDRAVIEVESCINAGDYLDAVDRIEMLFNTGAVPLYHQANLMRLVGDCFTRLGDSTSAKNAYNKALGIDPFSAKSHIGLGTVALTRNSYDGAVIHFQKAVSLAPNDEMGSFGLGLAFQGLGEVTEANKWVANACRLNPLNAPAVFTLVKLAYERNSYEDARQALCRFIESRPQDLNMVFSLAGLEFKVGNNTAAEMLLAQMLAIDPNDARAHQLLAQVRGGKEAHAGGANR